ncbi:MAG: hypothetical protein ACD_78C00117G0004 [uncultured bacterium (gcode 4)]|uniref:Uncharacterized protein n=1 Tax=uncultured bacterium (gcode 4) TaxID=1234023 RepID=K1YXV9_9BACT|nr:MAG: hypothetical protein ACD_78C00117G0004 [uncultured bacterium (gcode 4)]
MGDHGPTGFVLGFDVVGDACAGHLELLCSPHTVEVVIGEFLSLGDGFVDALLKGDILDLTENRCENVGEFFIEEFFVFLWRELFPDLLAEEHLGEDGGSFCEGEGAVVDGWFLALGEMSVGRVTELVWESGNVTEFTRMIEEDETRFSGSVTRKSSGAFAILREGIDSTGVEHIDGICVKLLVEVFHRLEVEFGRILEGEFLFDGSERSLNIGDFECIKSHDFPFGFDEPGEEGIGGLYFAHEHIDHFGFKFFGEISRFHDMCISSEFHIRCPVLDDSGIDIAEGDLSLFVIVDRTEWLVGFATRFSVGTWSERSDFFFGDGFFHAIKLYFKGIGVREFFS